MWLEWMRITDPNLSLSRCSVLWLFCWFLAICVNTIKSIIKIPQLASGRTGADAHTDTQTENILAWQQNSSSFITVTQMTSAGCSPLNQPVSDYRVVGVLHLLSIVVGNTDSWRGKSMRQTFWSVYKGATGDLRGIKWDFWRIGLVNKCRPAGSCLWVTCWKCWLALRGTRPRVVCKHTSGSQVVVVRWNLQRRFIWWARS